VSQRLFDRKAYMKKYMAVYNKEHYVQQREWMKQHPESRKRFLVNHPNYYLNKRKEYKTKIDTYNRNYNANNKEKLHAYHQIRDFPLAEICEICGCSENLVRHHPDYSEPLLYVTVCSSCHKYIHNYG